MKKVLVMLSLVAVAMCQSLAVSAQTVEPAPVGTVMTDGTVHAVIGGYDENDPTGSDYGIIEDDGASGGDSMTQIGGHGFLVNDDNGGCRCSEKAWHDGFWWYR
jgi:hypothetical protein